MGSYLNDSYTGCEAGTWAPEESMAWAAGGTTLRRLSLQKCNWSFFLLITNPPTQSSGVSVADECLDVYKEMQMGHKFRYIIYSLNPAQDTIIVERIRGKGEENSRASPEEKYADFLQLLAAKKDKGDCCYAVYDAEYKKRNGHDRSKIVFLVW